ncbi:hypothetical protein Tco_1213389 [Tanacetum coccineum]
MEFESAHSNTTAKLPILKLGEYEMWVIRIKQYFQVQDYALWEVIENGNSWVSVPQTTQENGTSVTKMSVLVTAEEKTNKKNNVKARSLLLMALPNEHQLTFSQYNDSKTMFAAIKTRFGGNKATKKTQKTLLKQQYENFSALSTEFLDSIFNRIHKIVSSTASFSDNTVYAFMVENPNGSNLLQQDLEKIHEDDLEAIDLKWQLSLLSMRAKRECRAPRNKEGQFRNQDNTRKHGNNEDTSSKAILAIDGVGFDWSDMAEEQVQTNMALMAFSDFELDLSYYGLDEFKEPEFKSYGSKNSKQESNIVCDQKSDDSKENSDDSLVKDQVSKDTSSFVESPLNVDKETVFLDKKIESVKPKNHEKPVKKSVRYAEMYRSHSPRGNQRNWNGQKSNQLGSDFVMYNKACFICGSFDHVQAHCKYHQRERMVYGNNYNRVNYNYTTKRTHPNAQRNMVPRAVLMKTGLKPFNTARTVNTAHPKSIVYSANPMSCFSKSAQSTVKRPFQPKTVLTNKRFTQKVNTAKAQAVNTARPKAVKTARPNSAVVNAVRVNQENAGKPQQDDTGFVDSGCSRHMTRNIAYLSDFKEFDGGYVTFGGGAHGGRIFGKGTLKTDSLDFKDVYFVNELKFNLFSVSQMCDKKNYVLFTDTECLVLSPNFKLPDESQILLKIPRKDNMYSFDMKNIVPKESLTCLVVKATLDESITGIEGLQHRASSSTSGSGTLPGNTVTNPKEDLKGITTRSGVTIQGPKAVNHDAEVTKDTMPPANNGSTEDVQPPVVQIQSRNPNPEPNVAPVVTPIPKASIPFPSRRNDERRKEKANDQIEKFYEIFRDLSFEISFTDALMLMPKFALTLKTLIGNKEKLSELARTPLNENCSAVILNKLPKKLGDPGRFLFMVNLRGLTTCNAIADLVRALISCLILYEQSISSGIDPDLHDSRLADLHALIDVYEGEITLRVGKEAITFNLDQTSRYTADYNHMMVNKIDVIDMACDEYSQEVLGFSNVIASGNPTPYFEPIVSTASPNLTPFGDSDFLLFEEADSFLALEDDPTSSEVDPTYQV